MGGAEQRSQEGTDVFMETLRISTLLHAHEVWEKMGRRRTETLESLEETMRTQSL